MKNKAYTTVLGGCYRATVSQAPPGRKYVGVYLYPDVPGLGANNVIRLSGFDIDALAKLVAQAREDFEQSMKEDAEELARLKAKNAQRDAEADPFTL